VLDRDGWLATAAPPQKIIDPSDREGDQPDEPPGAPDVVRHRTRARHRTFSRDRRCVPGRRIVTARGGRGAVTGPRGAEESLIAMAGILVTEQSLEATLREVLQVACAALAGGDEGGITLLAAGGPGTAVATSGVALRVDRVQYAAETGGPCLDAYRRQQVLRIDSTASDPRWLEFSGTAAAEGVRSVLSVPLVVGGDGLGALNIYCRRENGFPAGDERFAAALGSCASVTVANSRTFWHAARLAEQLEQSLSTRGAVDKATGILMAQHRCSAEHGLHLLAAAAQRNRLTLPEVARDLVERTANKEPPTG
jgi:hypothetical protein